MCVERGRNEGRNYERWRDDRDERNIAVMTFPIKKRIITELFIDRNNGLYIQKGDKETGE